MSADSETVSRLKVNSPPLISSGSSTPLSPTPPKRLPQELYDRILDHLWNDHRALRACSLTCRAWLPTTRVHLFHFLRLTSSQRCQRCADTLDSACGTLPSVSHFVRVLCIKKPQRSHGHAELLNSMCTKLAELLPKFSRVQQLQLSWQVLEHTPLPEILRLAIIKSLHQVKVLRLEHTTFQHSGDILQLLSSFPQLSSLYTLNLCVKTECLETLAFAAPSLHTLHLIGRDKLSAAPTAAILRNTSSELKHLTLSWTDFPHSLLPTGQPPTRDLVSLSSFTHLRELTLLIHLRGARRSTPQPASSALSPMHEILFTVNSPHLQKLSISLLLQGQGGTDFEHCNWGVIDDALAQLCEKLPDLTVTFGLLQTPGHSWQAYVERIVEAMPRARQYAGRFEFFFKASYGMPDLKAR